MAKSACSFKQKDKYFAHATSQLPVTYESELHRVIEIESYLCRKRWF
jgi:hypothetical protein